ncbi:Sulfatase [Tritonibacter multivorans]|uniref:Sulfatase n=1 Tax=Tritonibacter multivorans TaxID=928856 RepID=A0A0P1GAP2_9RHOB|nr:sulfatase-like hydrolase/transferase [Tritonibacter multivorans]MDA7422050.1 sulfatase-like hydrolase/transferase [Tritonibacter multivorans]CUH78567.1 Sulfatase [Tritonibacter multivorans]SFD18576.1 Sulfatase [Tritonibacter multivorans]
MFQDSSTGNHIICITMDSCRFDSFQAARTPNIDRLGEVSRRHSYASWTAPSHHAFSMGLLPHQSPPHILASEVYKEEFVDWEMRTGLSGINFQNFLPHLTLTNVLENLGYETVGRVSMPVLNPNTPFARGFSDFKLMKNHNGFHEMVDEMRLPEDEDETYYYFFNLGETHYPYMLRDESLPIISGLHGVAKRMKNDDTPITQMSWDEFMTEDRMKELRDAQIRAVEHVDELIGAIYEKAAKGRTHLIVTADHGELFGEDGYFGHGPIMHPKVFEVPFIEGLIT